MSSISNYKKATDERTSPAVGANKNAADREKGQSGHKYLKQSPVRLALHR